MNQDRSIVHMDLDTFFVSSRVEFSKDKDSRETTGDRRDHSEKNDVFMDRVCSRNDEMILFS